MYYSMFLGPRVSTPTADKQIIDVSIQQALEADEAGFSAIYVGEQHHNDYEPYSDPFTIGGYLASQLKNAWIGTSVVSLVLHHPLMLIERMNLLDLLTRGRVMYGISSGNPWNGAAFGIDEMSSELRAELFEQRLDVLMRAWAHKREDGPLTFETGQENGVMTGRAMPLSYRIPHPLIAVGTYQPDKIRQAGVRGLYVQLGPIDLGGAVRLADIYREGLQQGGYDDRAIEERMRWFVATKFVIVGETDDDAWGLAERQFAGVLHMLERVMPFLTRDEQFQGKTLRELHHMDPGEFAPAFGMPESPAAWSQRCHIVGSPDTVAAELKRWEEEGLSHLHARWLINDMDFDGWQRSWRLFVDEVVPRVGLDRMPAPTTDQIRAEFR